MIKPQIPRRYWVAAVIAAAVVLTAGCGSSGGSARTADDPASADSGSAESTSAESTSADSASADSASADATPSATAGIDPQELGDSPLDDLLGVPITDEAAMVEYELQLQRDVERSVSECMLREGFDYQPVDPSQFAPDGATIDSREDAEAVGFGLASQFAAIQAQAATSFVDPNESIRAGLSPAEADAYDLALYGESSGDGDDVERDFGFEDLQGCYGAGLAQAYSVVAVLDSFGSQIDELFQQFTSDPRIVAIDESWSRCMSDAGFNYASSTDIRIAFAHRVTEITGSAESFLDPEAASDSVLEYEESGALLVVMGGSTLTVDAQAELDVIAAEERTAAVASWDCEDPNRDEQAAILLEYEQKFVAENGELIKERLAEQE